MGAPGTETPTQKRPRTYSRHGLNTLRRALTTSVPGGEAGGESYPLTRGRSGDFREWGFCLCSDDPPRRRDDDRALVVVPALGARRDRSGERPLPRQEGHRARRARRLPDVRLARDRPRRPHLRRDVHQRRGSDIWPDDKTLALQLTGELLTLRSEQRAAPYGAAPRPETSADQLCQRNCCGLRADSWEIITLTSAGPLKAIASCSADCKSFGFSTNQPLPPKASIILS